MGLFSATDISVESVERDYAAVLVEGEKVLAAFRTIRDSYFLTDLRFVMIDVQGLTGKKVSVGSVPWRSVTKFSVETAGTFDLDADLKIWISGQGAPVEVKISRKSDAAGIQRLFAQHVLGRGS